MRLLLKGKGRRQMKEMVDKMSKGNASSRHVFATMLFVVAVSMLLGSGAMQASASDAPIVTLNTAYASENANGNVTLKSLLVDSNAADAAYESVTWTTNDSSVLTLTASGTSCVVTGHGAGTANVLATYDYKDSYGLEHSVYSACKMTVSGLATGSSATAGSGSTSAVYKATSNGGVPTASYVRPASSTMTTATVPSTVSLYGVTYRVNDVASKAFYRNTKLSTVSIGSYVASIGSYAFYGDSALKGFNASSTVLKTLGTGLFGGDKKLKAIYLTKTGSLSKSSVKNSLKSSSVTTVHVKSSKVAAYKKFFTKSNCGKSVSVRK